MNLTNLTSEQLIATEIALSWAVRKSSFRKRKGAGDVFLDRAMVEALAVVRQAFPDAELASLGLARDENGIVVENE